MLGLNLLGQIGGLLGGAVEGVGEGFGEGFGGLLGGAVEGVGGAARGVTEFIQENPEVAGLLGGALVGGQVGEGTFGAIQGLLSGGKKRARAEQQKQQQQQQQAIFKSKKLNDFQKQSVADKGIESARTGVAAAYNINSILDTGNPIAAGAVRVLFPRLLGEVGNLSQTEQAAFGGSKALGDKLDQIFEEWQTGKLTERNESFLRGIADTLVVSNVKRGNSRFDKLVSSQAKVGFNKKENLEGVINPLRFEIPEGTLTRQKERTKQEQQSNVIKFDAQGRRI